MIFERKKSSSRIRQGLTLLTTLASILIILLIFPVVNKANAESTDKDKKITICRNIIQYSQYRKPGVSAKMYIEEGCDYKSRGKMTDLLLADVSFESAKLLIEHGADVNDSDNGGYTPLMAATQYGNIEAVRFLIQKGANVNAKRSDRETALFIAVRRRIITDMLPIIDVLLDNGADIDAKGWYDETPLMKALSIGNIDVAEHLIKRGASMNALNNLGGAAINYATKYIAALKLLIKNGADVNSKGNEGASVLMGAARSGDEQVVKMLLENGADLNAKDNIGRSVLMYAAESGNIQVVKMLLEKGADVNVTDSNGDTALEGRYYTIAPEIRKLLVKKGAHYAEKYEGIYIVTPVEGQRFKMGDKGKIVVKAKAGVELNEVLFGFVPLSYHFWEKAYVGNFQIPNNIQPGKLEIKVYAYTKDGKETEATHNIIAEFPADVKLIGIDLNDYGFDRIYLDKLPPGSALANVEAYETEKLYVHGIYSDDIKRDDITSPSYGTSYSTSNEQVAIVTSDGIVKAIGIGKAVITAKNGKFTVSREVIVEPYKK